MVRIKGGLQLIQESTITKSSLAMVNVRSQSKACRGIENRFNFNILQELFCISFLREGGGAPRSKGAHFYSGSPLPIKHQAATKTTEMPRHRQFSTDYFQHTKRKTRFKGTGKPFFDLFDLMNKQVWHLKVILPLFVVDWRCLEILQEIVFIYRDKLEVWKFLDSYKYRFFLLCLKRQLNHRKIKKPSTNQKQCKMLDRLI